MGLSAVTKGSTHGRVSGRGLRVHTWSERELSAVGKSGASEPGAVGKPLAPLPEGPYAFALGPSLHLTVVL